MRLTMKNIRATLMLSALLTAGTLAFTSPAQADYDHDGYRHEYRHEHRDHRDFDRDRHARYEHERFERERWERERWEHRHRHFHEDAYRPVIYPMPAPVVYPVMPMASGGAGASVTYSTPIGRGGGELSATVNMP
jgi:hypothetical protein